MVIPTKINQIIIPAIYGRPITSTERAVYPENSLRQLTTMQATATILRTTQCLRECEFHNWTIQIQVLVTQGQTPIESLTLTLKKVFLIWAENCLKGIRKLSRDMSSSRLLCSGVLVSRSLLLACSNTITGLCEPLGQGLSMTGSVEIYRITVQLTQAQQLHSCMSNNLYINHCIFLEQITATVSTPIHYPLQRGSLQKGRSHYTNWTHIYLPQLITATQ